MTSDVVSPDRAPLFVASKNVILELRGLRVQVQRGVTIVRAGHPLVELLPHAFRPVEPSTWPCHLCGTTSELPWCSDHAPSVQRSRKWRRGRST
jgi:hypothetical protein